MCRRTIALILSLSFGTALADGLSFDDALRQAEANAPDLKAAEARRTSAAEAVEAADALPDPRAFVGLENVPIEGPDRFSLQRDFMTMQTMGVMQEFPNAGKRRAREAMAEAEAGSEEATLRLTRIKVHQEAAAAWLRRYYLERRREVLASLTQENETLQQTMTAQVRTGRKRPGDVLLARQEALSLADRQDEIERELTMADAMLRRWTGVGATPLTGEPPRFNDDPESWRTHVQHHPALQRFKPEAERARAELHEAEAARRPDWGVELAYQNRGDTFGDMMSLQVSADLPLFTRTRQTPQIRAKQQKLASIEAEQEAMRREHQAALEGDIARIIALKRQRDRFEKEAIPLAHERVALELSAYRAGTGELSSVLGARRELLELQQKQLQLQSDYETRLASLHYLFDNQEARP
ncbi:MAG: TolC family protein [Pseudomonadota bacterium]